MLKTLAERMTNITNNIALYKFEKFKLTILLEYVFPSCAIISSEQLKNVMYNLSVSHAFLYRTRYSEIALQPSHQRILYFKFSKVLRK